VSGPELPPELSRLDEELDAELGALRAKPSRAHGLRVLLARRISPGSSAVVIFSGIAMLLFALAVPWVGVQSGMDALVGATGIGPLPRLFSWTSIGFGVVVSIAALASRRWVLAWLCAVGCGFSIVDGALGIWSRQTGSVAAGTVGAGPGVGLVLAWISIVLLTATWTRLAWSREEPREDASAAPA
jgi:hypothetical protein